jgi:hypothetical protein
MALFVNLKAPYTRPCSMWESENKMNFEKKTVEICAGIMAREEVK